jgi:lysophospholipase
VTFYKTEEHHLPSSDGESSIFLKYLYRGSPRVHFILVHGALEHSGRHQELINFWMKSYQEISITVFDLVGHGKSGGARCYVNNFNNYVKDLEAVCNFVKSKNDQETKTFICAHSLGGLITLTWILDSGYEKNMKIDGLIFSSPCIRPKVFFNQVTGPLLKRMNQFTPKLHLPIIYKGADLSRDPSRANDFNTDALIPKFITAGMAFEIIKASEKLRGLSYYLRIPSLFLISGTDYIVDSESTKLFAQGVDKSISEIKEYPAHYHELWNEFDRKDIFQSMKEWVDEYLKG